MKQILGLAYAPLEPSSEAIRLVTYNGKHVGHMRLDGAVPGHHGRLVGTYPTAGAAARALARAAGKRITPNGEAT